MGYFNMVSDWKTVWALGLAMGCLLMEGASAAKPHEHLFESVRAYGRGRTGFAATDSYEATRFNPATLAERDVSFQLRFAEWDVFYGNDGVSEINSIAGTGTDASSLINTVSDASGTNINGRNQLGLFAVRVGGFEASPFFVADGQADLRNRALPEADFYVSAIMGINLTYSWAWSKQWSVGVTMRPLHRWYVGEGLGVVDLLDRTDFQGDIPVESGWGIGFDLGVIYAADKDLRFGATVQNIGDTEYFQDFGTEPPALKQQINGGVMKRFALLGGDLDLHADIQGLLNRTGGSMMRLVHLGLEQGYSVFHPKKGDHDYGVLLGLNEGYVGAGLFVDLYVVRLDIAQYGVELGHGAGQRPDRRTAFSLRSAMTF